MIEENGMSLWENPTAKGERSEQRGLEKMVVWCLAWDRRQDKEC